MTEGHSPQSCGRSAGGGVWRPVEGHGSDGCRGRRQLAEDLVQGDLHLGRPSCPRGGSSCGRAAGRWRRSRPPSAAAAHRAHRGPARSVSPRAGRLPVRPSGTWAGRCRLAAKMASIWSGVNVGRCSPPPVTTKQLGTEEGQVSHREAHPEGQQHDRGGQRRARPTRGWSDSPRPAARRALRWRRRRTTRPIRGRSQTTHTR